MSSVTHRFSQLDPVSSSELISVISTAASPYKNPFLSSNALHRLWDNSGTTANDRSPVAFHGKEDVVSAILGENLMLNGMPIPKGTLNISYPFSMSSALLSPVSLSTLASPRASEQYSLITDKLSFKRLKIIEELMESEQHYIDSLRLLCTSYIEPLLEVYQSKIGVPIILIDTYIKILIINHGEFLQRLESVYQIQCCSTPLGFDSDDVGYTTLELAKQISDLIVQYSISPYIYEQYCTINDQILKLMSKRDMRSNFFENFETIKLGCEVFTDLVQGKHQRMDLSFISLFQKPISRIPKYKLILESLLNQSTSCEEGEYELQSSIAKNLDSVKNQLNQVNENIKAQQEKMKKFDILFDSLNFSLANLAIMRNYFMDDDLSTAFSFEAFGYPVLCGGLALITVSQSNLLFCKYHGCVLFKSHLFIIDSRHHQGNKFDIKLMIPLHCCKLNGDLEGLVVVEGNKNFKITFEYNYQLFELLFLSTNQAENDIWVNYLDILINHVNGPYQFDYSLSGQKVLMYVFENMAPFDICLNRLSDTKLGGFKTNFNDCYFRKLRCIRIDPTGEMQENGHDYTTLEGDTIFLRRKDKLDIELRFKDVWSDELLKADPQHSAHNFHRSKNLEPRQYLQTRRNTSLLRRASFAFNGFLSRN